MQSLQLTLAYRQPRCNKLETSLDYMAGGKPSTLAEISKLFNDSNFKIIAICFDNTKRLTVFVM
jgi:hypothetical protein